MGDAAEQSPPDATEAYDHAVAEPVRGALARHLPALDGVRGIAIALVLVHNFNLDGPVGGAMGRAFNAALEVGWVGVQLFFVLSGFLITGILLDTRGAPNALRAFYARRLLRIFPLYYAVLALRFVVLPHVTTLPASLAAEQHDQIWYWTYLANWTAPFGHGVTGFGHFWSLAVEEQFYLVWPLVVLPLGSRGVRRVCAALVVVSLASRVAMVAAGVRLEAVYQFTLTRVDALAMGGWLAARLRDGPVPPAGGLRRQLIASAAACVLVALATRGMPRMNAVVQTIGFTALAWVFTAALAFFAMADAAGSRQRVVAWLRAPALRSLGRLSYAMYVFHLPVHLLLMRAFPTALAPTNVTARLLCTLLYIPIASALTFALAWISWHAFERHFLAQKRRFVARPTVASVR